MGLSGNLEDLALSDIIQIIHLSRKTGTLSLKHNENEGTIIFQDGMIIQASSSLNDVKLDTILVEKGFLTSEQIEEARELLDTQYEELHLNAILYKLHYIEEKNLDKLIQVQIEVAIFDLLQWEEGYFNFELDTIRGKDRQGEYLHAVMLKSGLTPQVLFSDAAKKIEGKTELSDSLISGSVEESTAQSESTPEQNISEKPESSESVADETNLESAISDSPSEQEIVDEVSGESVKSVTGEGSVILVDDEKVFLDLLSKKLILKGFKVFSFLNIDEALKKLNQLVDQSVVPILVSDLVFPTETGIDVLGGIEFLDEINKLYPYIPVIILSDQHDPKIRYQVYEHGARNYLYKPDRSNVKISKLSENIQQFSDELALCINNIFKERQRLQEMMSSLTTLKKATPKKQEVSQAHKEEIAQKTDELELIRMKQIFYELQNPKETSEVILLVLRLASEHLERGLLFLLQKDFLKGIGGFGNALDGEPLISKITSFRISLSGDSMFHHVIKTKNTFLAEPSSTPNNDDLYRVIGKPFNNQVVAIPLLSEGRIVAIFYGDNGSRMSSVENIVGLEIFINQAGIALENALLQKKLKGKPF